MNLGVALDAQRFGEDALRAALRAIEGHGFSVRRGKAPEAFLAWVDDEFGGTWSSEVFAGESVVATKDGAFAGFAAYDPRALQFSWLRGLASEPGSGIFGPFGVGKAFRGTGIGPHLLIAALASLHERGYRRAIIPAVGNEKLTAYYAAHSGARVVETFDRERWFEKKYRTIVLASGSGSNFQAVADRASQGRLPLTITALVSNNVNARALERARAANIEPLAIPWNRQTQSREAYDTTLADAVCDRRPDVVLLLGWMHLLPAAFVEAHACINIHPAFLPLDQRQDSVTFADGTVTAAFRGANAVADALRAGAKWTGATAHMVSAQADRGRILTRKPLAIGQGERQDELMRRLHPLEHATLAGGIMRWIFER